ncbi:MAG: hypothetical protein C4K47_10280 [Candidatus Thorarchaeota archaeon]|nr:MAG: hypothetical protein C4K47_10280 [Candidatus Thorarchaeota archaeon]
MGGIQLIICRCVPDDSAEELRHMTDPTTLTIDREIDDIKDQVRREIETIRDLMTTVGYRDSSPGWNAPFQIQRLRRALRIHYLALKIRDSTPVPSGTRELAWSLERDDESF